MYISKDAQTFWIGDENGNVSIRDMDTGTEEIFIPVDDERTEDIIWMRDVSGHVAVGTGKIPYR